MANDTVSVKIVGDASDVARATNTAKGEVSGLTKAIAQMSATPATRWSTSG